MSRLLARPLLAVMTACAAPGSTTPYPGAVQSAADARPPPQISEPELGWQRPLASPRPSWPRDPLLQRLAEVCGEHDQALSDAASRIALRQAHRQPPLDGLDLGLLLRSEGVPYVWPRTWSLSGRSLEPSRAIDSFARWLSRRHDGGVRRCGLARARNGSEDVVAAVAVDVLGDLVRPLSVTATSGQWVSFEARMLVDATAAKLVVLGPTRAPFTVPTQMEGGQVRARFCVDRPGRWVAQLLALVEGGVRPVLEAPIYVDRLPPTLPDSSRAEAPLEESAAADPEATLIRMLNQARQAAGLAPLAVDPRLAAAADRHARWMMRTGQLGHHSDQGDPRQRVRAAVPDSLHEGENVATARTLVRAHRVLLASPSHRGNLLDRRYDSVGVGVARDESGSLWVCELFSDRDGR